MSNTPDDHPASADPEQASAFSAKILEKLAERHDFGRYEVKGEVARGGQGAILHVWDKDLRRDLAMKVAHGPAQRELEETSEGASRTLGRFLEEAQVTGQLEHPGIVPVHELGLDPQERVYFTMRLVKGSDLVRVFELVRAGEEGWNETRALGVVLRACEALSYAHSKRVIHRDLKPANIMVGRFGEVYVMDWGLGRILGTLDDKDIRIRPKQETASLSVVRSDRRDQTDSAGDSSLVTMDGDIMGTPAFMSPEQARGDAQAMGPASDVYSMGAILYQLLAGHAPYVPPDARLNAYAVWGMVQNGPPTPLSQVAKSAPEELIAICEKAMLREPGERYAGMHALAEDLRAFLENRVVQAHKTGAVVEFRKWMQRNKALAASLATAVLLLAGGLATSLVFKARADGQAAIATARADDVLRLSALQDLEALRAEADALWPAHAENISAYGEWIRRARALVADLPLHRAKRAELRAGSLPEDLEPQERWWDNQLSKLIAGLAGLETGLLSDTQGPIGSAGGSAGGWSVPRRLAFAERLRDGYAAGGDLARGWGEALPELRRTYPGLTLVPQIGLVPLGPDPDTGLWEFADLATGDVAQRDATGKLRLDESSGLVFVLLPGGTFTMGAQWEDESAPNYEPEAGPEEAPPHEVTLSPFFLSKYEMTQGQWRGFTGINPSKHQPPDPLAPSLLHPVENVSWLECQQVCARLGLMLPSEAQWEYGTRAGTTSSWWTGNRRKSLRTKNATNLADQAAARGGAAWADIRDWPALDDGSVFHAPVDEYAPNPFGLHNVHGNIWEWCRDVYEDDFYARSPERDPLNDSAKSQARVFRGGGFDETAAIARSAARDFITPEFADDFLGLRPARALQVR